MKTFLLVQIIGSKTIILFEGAIQLVQFKKKELKNRGMLLQIRTLEGYKTVPILPIKKTLVRCQKTEFNLPK